MPNMIFRTVLTNVLQDVVSGVIKRKVSQQQSLTTVCGHRGLKGPGEAVQGTYVLLLDAQGDTPERLEG